MKKKLLLCGLCICLAALPLSLYFRQDSRFEKTASSLFRTELSANTLNLHYTLAHPEHYGIGLSKAVLPVYCREEHTSLSGKLERYQKTLAHLSPKRMNPENRRLYTLLTEDLALENQLAAFPYYEEPLSPSSGMQSQLPILLAEYTFREPRDVEDYLDLLEQTGPYFDGLAAYEQEKAAAGLFMADFSAAKVIEQCDSIMDQEALKNGTHFLQETFRERLAELPAEAADAQARELWCSENDRLLSTVMQPAYDRLADALCLLSGSGSSEEGLCSLPQGKAYYELLVRKQTGSGRSLPALYERIKKQWKADLTELQQAASDSALQAVLTQGSSGEKKALLFPELSTETILKDLREKMNRDFPAFPQTEETLSLEIKRVSPSLEAYTAPAFYLTPPLDDSMQNVIYINPSSTRGGLELYTTLAHEGFPGHLYQSVYENLTRLQAGASPANSLLFYGGYSEGWAFYVEMLAYDYAAALQQQRSGQAAADLITCIKLDRKLQLGLYSLLDIGIHYYGMDFDAVKKALTAYGIEDETAIRRVYEYLVEEPGTYLKYYIGYLEILDLQQAARTHWGDAFTLYRFHDFLLKEGPASFPYLNQVLEESTP